MISEQPNRSHSGASDIDPNSKKNAITEPILPIVTQLNRSVSPSFNQSPPNQSSSTEISAEKQRSVQMPGVFDGKQPEKWGTGITSAAPARSSWLARVWSGLRNRLSGWRRNELVRVDPLNSKDHCFTKVEYVSRWGLVESGVFCPRCEALAAGRGQWKRVWKSADGDCVTCPECKSTLLASPTTEKEEHLLPYSDELHTFSRKRHQFSPYSAQQAWEIREQRQSLAERLSEDAMTAVKPPKESPNV